MRGRASLARGHEGCRTRRAVRPAGKGDRCRSRGAARKVPSSAPARIRRGRSSEYARSADRRGGGEVLALVELDNEPGLGNPEVARRQKRCLDEVLESEAAMILEGLADAFQLGLYGSPGVRAGAARPCEAVIRHTLAVQRPKELAHAELAVAATLGVAPLPQRALAPGLAPSRQMRAVQEARRETGRTQPAGCEGARAGGASGSSGARVAHRTHDSGRAVKSCRACLGLNLERAPRS